MKNLGGKVNQVRLPRLFSLIREGGFWILRTGDDAKPTHNQGQVLSPSMVRIGPALGSEALSERSALLLARRHIVVRSRGDIRTNCSRLTVLDFVRDQFVPAFVSAKSSSVRSYYGSALNYVLTPDEVGRMFNADLVQGKKHRSTFPDWPYLNNIRLCDVQLKHVQQLIDSAMNSGYSPQTIKHIRSVVATILSYAKQELMYVGPNPALAAKLPESCRKDRPALTLEQLEQVLRSMRYPEREMTMMALLTDLTVSEICGLQWKNVNLTGGWSEIERQPIPPISIFVNKQWYRGKLVKVRDSRKRHVQIPEVLLSTFVLLSGRSRFTGPDDFVLTSRFGTAINVSNITARRLTSIGEKLGIPGLSWLAFRRTHTTMKASFGPRFQYHVSAAVRPDFHQEAKTPPSPPVAAFSN